MRLIDAEYVLKRIPPEEIISKGVIAVAPTIEPKRGKWVKTKYGFEQCSLCKVSGSVIWKFCPRCGARMDEVEKDG